MFHEIYLKMMENCLKHKQYIPEFSPLNLSTMTIIGSLNNSNIDIKYFSENFTSPVHPFCILKKTKKHGDYIETKRGKVKKSFYNQVTIQYRDTTTKSIKLFSNGKLQITGITSLNEASKVCKMMKEILNTTFEKSLFEIVSIEIGMINTNFSFGRKIDIIQLKHYLKEKPNTKIKYEPDVYPGLKVKHFNTSIFVFATGNVLLTGVKSIEEIQSSLNFIFENVYSNWNTLNIGTVQPKKQNSASINYINGYKENEYNCASQWVFPQK